MWSGSDRIALSKSLRAPVIGKGKNPRWPSEWAGATFQGTQQAYACSSSAGMEKPANRLLLAGEAAAGVNFSFIGRVFLLFSCRSYWSVSRSCEERLGEAPMAASDHIDRPQRLRFRADYIGSSSEVESSRSSRSSRSKCVPPEPRGLPPFIS